MTDVKKTTKKTSRSERTFQRSAELTKKVDAWLARGKEDAEHKGEEGKNAEGKDVKEVVSDS